MKIKERVYDVLIAGCGVAGMYGALNLPDTVSVLLLAKYDWDVSNSNLAQGGIAAVLDLENDSYELHTQDTFIAGRKENDPDAVDVLVHEGPVCVRDIMDNMGVEFDRLPDGSLDKTLEGGHCRRRIMHSADSTGAEMVRKLHAEVLKRRNITVLTNTTLYDITALAGGFRADLLAGGEPDSVFASFVMLCTGGVGRIYRFTTNPKTATGDGIRVANDLGAEIKDLSYIQFHPTAFNSPDGEQFLVSESVRGEGAYLLNCNKERFMHRYDERLELAPRDVVSHAIIAESRLTGSDRFYLDIRHEDPEFVKKRFPGIRAGCLRYGVDIVRDLIPIFPCQHYLMGGIRTDVFGRTRVPRLYAAGECANTGVHGRNRLASNSLLEALVFSRRAAKDIVRCMDSGMPRVKEYPYTFTQRAAMGDPVPYGLREELQTMLQKSYFVVPDYEAARAYAPRAAKILRKLQTGKYAVTNEYCETLSIASMVNIILREVTD